MKMTVKIPGLLMRGCERLQTRFFGTDAERTLAKQLRDAHKNMNHQYIVNDPSNPNHELFSLWAAQSNFYDAGLGITWKAQGLVDQIVVVVTNRIRDDRPLIAKMHWVANQILTGIIDDKDKAALEEALQRKASDLIAKRSASNSSFGTSENKSISG